MLCGHAAPIADLSICYPVVVSGDVKETDYSSNGAANSISGTCGALISACVDGLLCVWSRGSGHCRRRRKLPPWIGSPSIIRTLPASSRYVCIGCCLGDSAQLSDHHSIYSIDGSEDSADKEPQPRKPPRCTVVIVDTYSLTIVQTVFHGNLSIGPLRFMDVVLLGEEGEQHSVFMADSYARLLTSDTKIGEISFLGNLLSVEGNSTQSCILGGMFLESFGAVRMQNTQEAYENFWENFAVWNRAGSAVVYVVSYLDDVFKCELLSEIPAASYPLHVRLSVSFIQSNNHLLRFESVCFDVEEPLQWKPHVTIWSLCQKHDKYGELSQCKILGECDLFAEWISSSSLLHEIYGHGGRKKEYPLLKVLFHAQKMKVVNTQMVKVAVLCMGTNYSHGRSPRDDVDSHVFRQYFTGHSGAVLCLAAHQMLVLHQHVAPVRQIIFSPAWTEHPWSDCFLSVGEDSCVSLASLETLRVERMFPSHPSYPEKVVWDGARGYIACLCQSHSGTSDVVDVLYIWDVKTGALERVLRGTASHSMLDHFCKGISANSISGSILNGNTSVSSLLLPVIEDGSFSPSHKNYLEKRNVSSNTLSSVTNMLEPTSSQAQVKKGNSAPTTSSFLKNSKYPIRCTCPFPGIATLTFDLASLMFSCQKRESVANGSDKLENTNVKEQGTNTPSPHHVSIDDSCDKNGISIDAVEGQDWISELDKLLMMDMKLKRPENFILASGLQGDKGSLTLTFPGLSAALELWKSSSEFCAMRSLTMVSIAQGMISLSPSSSAASRALAAFYTRNFADQIPDIKPPLLQLLVSFWQDESEHVRMAARTLFHCAASRAIPFPLCGQRTSDHAKLVRSLSEIGENEGGASKAGGISDNGLSSGMFPQSQGSSQAEEAFVNSPETQGITEVEESKILAWLESFEVPDWISCVGGTSQDAMTSHIIVAAALAIWYPSLVKPSLAMLVVQPLIKLVMAANEKYSSTAAELLAEAGHQPAVPSSIREILVGVLLPSLAVVDILGFLTVIESQIWSTASDSPVHLVVNFILHTMDPGNLVMRKTCIQSSMTALREVVRVFPMVALNDTSTRLAVGDAIGEVNNASISVYDMQRNIETAVTTVISALSFSPDGEGLVAFSEHGLMIRWWSLGSVWWEKLSRSLVPVHCTKLIFVPPWEGFSPNSARSSVMASIMGHDRQSNLQDNARSLSYADSLKMLIQNFDFSYRLEWVGQRKEAKPRADQSDCGLEPDWIFQFQGKRDYNQTEWPL
ncbi:hypothetical protein GH714_010572 [Hevea brasiliensis]|uniref:Uncharacterized protein n=1 Tax=Hevea brasiliensis TaxID=3981 RepID=A0A6A6MJB2_HEVBR|nr:hypothetical protein GH714_010572 [Hevea brasiliensis]